jgi:hypothetical protein
MRRDGLILLIALVAGCAAPANQHSVNAPVPRVAQYASAKAALSGQPQRIDYFYSVNPDCSSVGTTTIREVTPPKNGTITFTSGENYPDFKVGNIRYACNSKKVPVTNLVYQSNQGFTGTDTIKVEVLFPSGDYRTSEYMINVR